MGNECCSGRQQRYDQLQDPNTIAQRPIRAESAPRSPPGPYPGQGQAVPPLQLRKATVEHTTPYQTSTLPPDDDRFADALLAQGQGQLPASTSYDSYESQYTGSVHGGPTSTARPVAMNGGHNGHAANGYGSGGDSRYTAQQQARQAQMDDEDDEAPYDQFDKPVVPGRGQSASWDQNGQAVGPVAYNVPKQFQPPAQTAAAQAPVARYLSHTLSSMSKSKRASVQQAASSKRSEIDRSRSKTPRTTSSQSLPRSASAYSSGSMSARSTNSRAAQFIAQSEQYYDE